MATAMIFEGRPVSAPAGTPRAASAPAVTTSAWPAPVRIDYDAHRAEAHRLRTQAMKDTLLLIGRRLRCSVAG